MKKLFSVFMVLALVLGLAACGSKNDGEGISQGTVPESSMQTVRDESSADEDAGGTEAPSDTQEPVQTEEPGGSLPEETEGAGAKALVVYFSATGNTKAVAETLAELQGADIYEIVPEQPYTDEDLNYNDRTTRATAEQNAPNVRPDISGNITDFEQYEVVYVGFPIWWASIPMPIASFLEEYDFSGKTVIPFCSHGGGRFGQSLTAIAKLVPDAEMGEALSIHYSGGSNLPDEITEWLRTNGIIE